MPPYIAWYSALNSRSRSGFFRRLAIVSFRPITTTVLRLAVAIAFYRDPRATAISLFFMLNLYENRRQACIAPVSKRFH